MSDTSQGPGWWLASDGRWYPPEQWTGPPNTSPLSTGAPTGQTTAPAQPWGSDQGALAWAGTGHGTAGANLADGHRPRRARSAGQPPAVRAEPMAWLGPACATGLRRQPYGTDPYGQPGYGATPYGQPVYVAPGRHSRPIGLAIASFVCSDRRHLLHHLHRGHRPRASWPGPDQELGWTPEGRRTGPRRHHHRFRLGCLLRPRSSSSAPPPNPTAR